MRILLDEYIPRKLKESLTPHDCRTVAEQRWRGKKNGDLLTLAEQDGFQVFLTLYRGIEYQQNLNARSIAVLLLRSKSTRVRDLVSLVPTILEALLRLRPGQLTKVVQEGEL